MTTSQNVGNFTMQADVGPGSSTGVYYITFCNLPFDATWQQFKDWLRPHCEVEHVQIFRNSTSGWVRLRGHENFCNAWKCLDGGVFGGRSVIACDRNRTEAIKIKEAVDSRMRGKGRSPDLFISQPGSPALYGSPVSSLASPIPHDTHLVPVPTEPGGNSWFGADLQGSPVPVASICQRHNTAFHELPSIADRLSNATNRVMDVAPRHVPVDHLSPAAIGPTNVAESPRPSVHDNPVLLLNNLPLNCSTADVHKFIHRKFGSYDEHIMDIYVPEDGRTMRSRGEAVMKLRSPADLRFTVEKLHMVQFKGRTVTATVYFGDYVSAKGQLTGLSGEEHHESLSGSSKGLETAGSVEDNSAIVSKPERKLPGNQKAGRSSRTCSGRKSAG